MAAGDDLLQLRSITAPVTCAISRRAAAHGVASGVTKQPGSTVTMPISGMENFLHH